MLGQTSNVTIHGYNFGNTPTLAVSGSGITATILEGHNETTITASVEIDPAAQTGSRSLTVSARGLTSNTASFTAGDATPTITGITPPFGEVEGVIPVIIQGSGFGSNPTITVSGTGITATVTTSSPTQINALFSITSTAEATSRIVTITSNGLTGTGFVSVPLPGGGTSSPSSTTAFLVRPKVYIRLNGQRATTATNVIVGQKIALSAEVLPPSTTVSSYQWDIPGVRIANYVASGDGRKGGTRGQVTQLATTDFTQPTINFYWVDGGENRPVTLTITAGGKSYGASSAFNVKRPTADVGANIRGAVQVSQVGPNGVPSIDFGSSATIPGITFGLSSPLVIPQGFTGTTNWIQTTTATRQQVVPSGPKLWLANNLLDQRNPYSSDLQTNDSPGMDFFTDATSASVSDQYSMWFMFKPDVTDAIWVPLVKIQWGWSASATRSNGQWSLSGTPDIPTPQVTTTTEHPQWTRSNSTLTWF